MPYFDANATTPLLPVARAAWLEAVEGDWANPSSPTRAGARARLRLERCREAWARDFAVPPAQIVFTAGATEANNAVLAHLAQETPADARVLISAVEHPCVREAAQRWFPGRVDTVPVDALGRVDAAEVARRLAAEPYGLVAVMAANNETGVLQPVREVAAACRRAGARFLCDAAQWAGKRPVAELPPADFLTLSGHKFGGPRATGVLVLGGEATGFRGRVGGGQESNHHAGTEDVAGVAALTAAWQAQPAGGWSEAGRRWFEASLEGRFRVLGAAADRLPNTVAIVVPRHAAIRWIARLDRRGWAVSSGAACSSGGEAPSVVVRAMGLEADEARRVLRLSALPDATVDDWRGLLEALEAVGRELDADAMGPSLATVVDLGE